MTAASAFLAKKTQTLERIAELKASVDGQLEKTKADIAEVHEEAQGINAQIAALQENRAAFTPQETALKVKSIL